jgi:PAS domain S-box-containing protein
VNVSSQPLPLIVLLARNMIETLDVPAYLTGQDGELLSVNEAAGELTGQVRDEFGRLAPEHWASLAPRDPAGGPLATDRMPLMQALRRGTPAHGRFHVRAADGRLVEVETTAFPLCDETDLRGAVALFWPSGDAPSG